MSKYFFDPASPNVKRVGDKYYIYSNKGTIQRIVSVKDVPILKPKERWSLPEQPTPDYSEETSFERRKRLLKLAPHKQVTSKADGLDKEISFEERKKRNKKPKTKRSKK